MSHTMIFNSELRIVEINYQGIITFDEIKEAFLEAVQVMQDDNCFLTMGDYRGAKVILSTTEIHQLPKVIADLLAPSGVSPYQLKRAFVVAKDLDDFHFFETVTRNSGQQAKIFQNVDDARKWLLQE